MTDNSLTPAGWYPAAHAGGEQRYWDGNQWLDIRPEQVGGGRVTAPGTVAQATAPQSDASTSPRKPLNIVGLISLIVAGIGFVFACIPGALIVGWVLLPTAFVLALVSLFLTGRGKGLGIAGLIVSIVGTIIGVIVFMTIVAVAFDDAFNSGGATVVTAPSTAAEQEPAENAAEEPEAIEGSRDAPYPIGSAIENAEWRVVVNSVTLAATDTVLAANSFNEAPAEGNEYIVVNISATYVGTDDEGAMPAWIGVEYVTADGNTVNSYDNLAVAPDPSFDSLNTLYTDATATGNIVFEVPSATAGAGVLAISPGLLGDKVFVSAQ